MSSGGRVYDGVPAALPLAAASTLLLGRWLPVEFSYRPNDLGIVSLATQQRYPVHQETFWLAFGLGAGALGAWLASRLLVRKLAPGGILAVEGCAALALLCALWLPALAAAPLCAAASFVAVRLARRGSPADAHDPSARAPNASRRSALWLLAVLPLVPLFAPGLSVHLYTLFSGIPDTRLVQDNFKFLGEAGQHLAWANALSRGDFQGRDFFCLYGPLYDQGLASLWKLIGRSAASWSLYWALNRVLGWLVLLVLAAVLLRRRALFLLLPLLLPWTELRMGLPLAALLCLHLWLVGGRAIWGAASGVLAGTALLYSQEFALAFLLCAALAFALRRDLRAFGLFAAGVAAVVAPFFAWYAANDALVPLLRDAFQYPGYVLSGYAKLPFPALFPELPMALSDLDREGTRLWRLGYAAPAICLGGALLALPVSSLDPRRPLASARNAANALARDPARLTVLLLALFGLLAFRSALGRSDLHHLERVLPPAALLLCLGADRVLDGLRIASERALSIVRLALLALLVGLAGFGETPRLAQEFPAAYTRIGRLASHGFHPTGARRVLLMMRWVEENAEPGDPILFLPNDAAYYYLTDRPSPIRFVLGSQLAGSAHRNEVLADLQRRPPRFVVWDQKALRLDDLEDAVVFGPAVMEFFANNYTSEVSFSSFDILRHRGDTGVAAPAGDRLSP